MARGASAMVAGAVVALARFLARYLASYISFCTPQESVRETDNGGHLISEEADCEFGSMSC
jgi:hypothetical protein